MKMLRNHQVVHRFDSSLVAEQDYERIKLIDELRRSVRIHRRKIGNSGSLVHFQPFRFKGQDTNFNIHIQEMKIFS